MTFGRCLEISALKACATPSFKKGHIARNKNVQTGMGWECADWNRAFSPNLSYYDGDACQHLKKQVPYVTPLPTNSALCPQVMRNAGGGLMEGKTKVIIFSQFWIHINLVITHLTTHSIRHTVLRAGLPHKEKLDALDTFQVPPPPCSGRLSPMCTMWACRTSMIVHLMKPKLSSPPSSSPLHKTSAGLPHKEWMDALQEPSLLSPVFFMALRPCGRQHEEHIASQHVEHPPPPQAPPLSVTSATPWAGQGCPTRENGRL